MSTPSMAEFWNSEVASAWSVDPGRYDRMLEPFGRLVLGVAALQPGERVLDVGCGAGQLALQAAEQVGDGGAVTGIDVAEASIEVAKQRAAAAGLANVEFVAADAHVHRLTGEYDAVISRFGVMFFEDPVQAFTNLRSSAAADGRLAFVCWKPLAENEWAMVPAMAVIPHVGMPELPPPGAPGPFAFEDPDRVRAILGDAGWSDVGIEPVATSLLLGGGPTVDDAVTFFREDAFGRNLLDKADPAARDAALDALRAALGEKLTDEGVRMDASVWLVTARASARSR